MPNLQEEMRLSRDLLFGLIILLSDDLQVLMRLFFYFVLVVCGASCIQIENAEKSENKIVEDTTSTADYSIQEYSATSLLGEKLYAPAITKRDKSRRETELSEALENFNSNPDSLQFIVWFGRRLSHLFLYKEAIKVYSDGLEKYPESYELYRHRGECFLVIRDFDNAVIDLEKAAYHSRNAPIVMEEGSVRNSRNIPRMSLQFNIWYRLGMTYYFKGNYDKAISAFKKSLSLSNNDDMLVLASDWLYMTYRRLGNLGAANELLDPVKGRMNVIENKAYHYKLLMYKDLKSPSEIFDVETSSLSRNQLIQGYGVGNWYFYNGHSEQAIKIFNKLLTSDYWPSLGYLAAEVDLSQLQSENTPTN